MSNQLNLGDGPILETPKQRHSFFRYLTIPVALLSIGGIIWGWEAGYGPSFLDRQPARLELVEVDQGNIVELIVENGSLESASNTVVKCEVEALVGLFGGATGTTTTGTRTGNAGSGQSGSGGRTSGGAQGGAGGQGAAMQTQATTKPKASSRAEMSKGSSSSRSGSSSTASSGGSTKSSASSSSGGSSTASSSASSSSTTTVGNGVLSGKPMIRSFSYMVTPYMALRPSTGKSTTSTQAKGVTMDASGRGGGGGGGGRGGRGGGGGGGMGEEKPGSTRIISILPEGTKVKAGDLVCELDSASFRDEYKAQSIRHVQATAWVEQAKAILEVNQITLREYRDGIFPQDMLLIKQYIQTCQIEQERAERNVAWSRDVASKKLRPAAQLKADELDFQQSTIALNDARGMLERLEKFTAPKILKTLEAKVAANRADMLTQAAALALETERLNRLAKNIARCTLRAPIDGSVVYVNQTNGWGRVEGRIEEGVTVREGQPIFELPDPQNMRVKAKINETMVSRIRSGQTVRIKVDAFPERELNGIVGEVTAISTPVNGPFSDVRIYFATVSIEQGFKDLKPGLTAEVFFKSDTREQVARVPLQTVRRIDGKTFVALHDPSRNANRENPWRWHRVELGISDPYFIEVVSGLKPGDRVVANPNALSAPTSIPDAPSESTVASLSAASVLP